MVASVYGPQTSATFAPNVKSLKVLFRDGNRLRMLLGLGLGLGALLALAPNAQTATRVYDAATATGGPSTTVGIRFIDLALGTSYRCACD